MKRKNKRMERKKRRSVISNRILIHSNVSNRMILIHSNVSKSFKKQHTNTLDCFANRRSLDKTSNSMDEKFFLKKIEVTRFTRFQEHFFKSYKKVFNCLMISIGSNPAFNWSKTIYFFKKVLTKAEN